MSSELSQISFARVDLRISASWCGLNLASWSFSYQNRSESLATTNCSACSRNGKGVVKKWKIFYLNRNVKTVLLKPAATYHNAAKGRTEHRALRWKFRNASGEEVNVVHVFVQHRQAMDCPVVQFSGQVTEIVGFLQATVLPKVEEKESIG